MQSERKYRHLAEEERAVIMIEHAQGRSARMIGTLLGRSFSTITREIRRTVTVPAIDGVGGYNARLSGESYRERRRHCGRRRKLVPGTALFEQVRSRLVYLRWSPQQIAAKLRLMHLDDTSQQVSHETIYAAIYAYPRGALKLGMIEALRQHKPRRGTRRTTLARGFAVPEALRIVHRPEAIEGRLVPGHWEGDFIKGAFNRSAVGTVVERKTRFVVLCRMGGCTAQDAVEGFARQMKKVPACLRESLTYDRGSEMAAHAELARRLNIDIWFADPYTPWQRGSNENTNGLLRQFLPKGMDLSTVSQTELNDIAHLLNHRPRQTLGWKSPAEVMAEEIAKLKTVALDS